MNADILSVPIIPQDAPGASKAMVLGKLAQQQAVQVSEDILSIEMSCPSGTFFIPQPPDGLYYTVGQLTIIEYSLEAFNLDLLPLDPYITIN